MKHKIYSLLIIGFITSMVFLSCSKKDDATAAASQTCYLATIVDSKGKTLEKYTYDTSNRLIKDVSDTSGVVLDFAYNTQSLVSLITVSVTSTSGNYSYTAGFTYDASGKATKAIITLQGATYLTNTFEYTGSQATKVTSINYNGSTLVTRFEYTGDNITKVYQKEGSATEYLYYEVTKFDDKKISYPVAYQALALGLTGILDGSSYLSKNNALSEKYYSSTGTVGYTSENALEYDSHSLPTKITAAINSNGTKSTNISAFQYNCK